MEPNFGWADGDNQRPAEAAAQRRQEEEDGEGHWIVLCTSLVVTMSLIKLCYMISVFFDLLFLVVKGQDHLHLGPLMRLFYITGPLCEPASQILLYHVYNHLEQEAFENFEV